jgi:hypothetical protein
MVAVLSIYILYSNGVYEVPMKCWFWGHTSWKNFNKIRVILKNSPISITKTFKSAIPSQSYVCKEGVIFMLDNTIDAAQFKFNFIQTILYRHYINNILRKEMKKEAVKKAVDKMVKINKVYDTINDKIVQADKLKGGLSFEENNNKIGALSIIK